MSKSGLVHGSFVLERSYKAAPERVFAAWADPVQKRRWFVEGENFTIDAYRPDFRVGGVEHSAFRYLDGPPMTNDAYYHDIEPSRRIVSSYSMTLSGKVFSVSLATLELEPEGPGTLLRYTEQTVFYSGSDGVDGRREGCRSLLEKLAEEVGG